MICRQCGAVLPDESRFCPYCMDKFEDETEIKNPKKSVIAAFLIVFLLIFTVLAIMLIKPGRNNGRLSSPSQTGSTSASGKSQTAPKETSTAEINGRYYEPGTYFYNIDGEGEIVLETFDYYPF